MKMSTFFNWARVPRDLEKRGIYMGTNTETQAAHRTFLSLKWLETHLHLMGPPGSGKTRLLLWLFEMLTFLPKVTIILMNPKGDLGRMARDFVIGRGLAHRLDYFDPGDSERVLGWNPVLPNGLGVATHAKALREGIRAGWGQHSFDQTPQLARFLFLALAVVRELELTLADAVSLLRPNSPMRKQALRRIQDPFVKESLVYFDGLSPRRQEELAASSVAKLEAFVCDPLIRRILTASPSLDIGTVLAEHRILIVNTELYRPLRPDDVKLLLRLFVNELVAHVFARPPEERTPVILIGDECHLFATEDLCESLELGRELNLFCILANQHQRQLQGEDGTGRLWDSVRNCARTKALFGGMSVEDLEDLTPEMFLEEYDPWDVKDELTSLELDPVESTREVVALGSTESTSVGSSRGTSSSTTIGHATGESVEHGTSQSRGGGATSGKTISSGRTHTEGKTRTTGRSSATGMSRSRGQGHTDGRSRASGVVTSAGSSAGRHAGSGTGEVMAPETSMFMLDGDTLVHTSHNDSQGHSDSTFEGESVVATEGVQESDSVHSAEAVHQSEAQQESESIQESDARQDGEAVHYGESDQWSDGLHESEGSNTTRSTAETDGETESVSETATSGITETTSEVPFYEYEKSRVVSSRQFLSKDDFLTLRLQELKGQPRAHYVLKVPGRDAVFLAVPFVETPRLSRKLLSQGLTQILEPPRYLRLESGAVMPPPKASAKSKKPEHQFGLWETRASDEGPKEVK